MARVLFSLFVVFVLSHSGNTAEAIRVGAYLPLTGHKSYGGKAELAGIELAHSLYPIVAGRQVELAVRDNQSSQEEAARVVGELAEEEDVIAILGTFGSDLALAGGVVAEAAGVPVIGTSCTNPEITQGKKYIFRACFTDSRQGAGAATYAVLVRGFKRAALFTNQNDAYSVGIAAAFRETFERLGGKIVGDERLETGDRDFRRQLEAIAQADPDVMFVTAYFPEGSVILRQARETGARYDIMGGDSMENAEIVQVLGKDAEGFIQTTFPYSPLMPDMTPAGDLFTTVWMETHPDTIPNVNAALGFTSYLILKDALERATRLDREAVTAALGVTRDVPSPLGHITLNEDHDAIMGTGVTEVRGGVVRYFGEVIPE